MKNIKLIMLIFSLLFMISCVENSKFTKSENNSIIPNKNCPKGISSVVTKPCKPYLYVIGKGAPPNDENLTEVQRYLLAERAAIVDGYRKLAEKLEGVVVTALTQAGNYSINMDRIKVTIEAMIKGAEIVEIVHQDNGICTAKIKIKIPKEKDILSFNF